MVGFVKPQQWERAHAGVETNVAYEEFVQKMADGRNIPLGRIGETGEFANVACFLALDHAGFVTGTSINVGGRASPVV